MDKQGHKASRTIEVTVLSAENLRLDRKSVKKNTYVIARAGPLNSGSTKDDFEGGSNPSWNEKITLDLPFQTRFISLEVKCRTSSGDRVIGTASLPISDILEDYTPENHLHFLSYRLKDSRGGRNGVINVSARVQTPVDSVCPSATKNPSGYGCSSSWQQPALGVPVGHQQNYYGGIVTGVPVWS
uniref:C2 domain-containing protein n=1 Tax=Populus davidiana TaxID=266767 RepID=A0A6M2EVG5_9ROSI